MPVYWKNCILEKNRLVFMSLGLIMAFDFFIKRLRFPSLVGEGMIISYRHINVFNFN